MVGQHDVGRQILVDVSQAIVDPRAHRGEPGPIESGGLQQRCLAVDAGLALEVVDERHFVDHFAQRGDHVAEHLARVAVGLEIPDRPQPGPQPVLKSLDMLAEIGGLAVVLDQRGFEIEQVDVAGCPRHEELNDPFGLGWMMQHTRGTGRGQQLCVGQHAGQGNAPQSATATEEKLSPRDRCRLRIVRKCGAGLHVALARSLKGLRDSMRCVCSRWSGFVVASSIDKDELV